LRRWLAGLVVAGGVLAAWLLVGFLAALPDGIGAPHGFYRVKVQVTSPVGDHNTAAGLLLPPLVAAAALAARDRRWLAGLLLVTLGVAATLSRGAVVVLLVVAAGAWVVSSGRRIRVLLASAAGAALVLVLGVAALDASPPPDGPQSEGVVGASVVARADLVVRGLEVGLDRPLAGVGLGGFGEVARDLPPPNDHAHQLFAHAFAEGGVILLTVAVSCPRSCWCAWAGCGQSAVGMRCCSAASRWLRMRSSRSSVDERATRCCWRCCHARRAPGRRPDQVSSGMHGA
jgi:hypothetical protein